MHDVANIAVFLPRSLDLLELFVVLSVFVIGLRYTFSHKGGRIQNIVKQKSQTQDIRSATIVDAVYAAILIIFKENTDIPMSTTWVFLGLLAGRELVMAHTNVSSRTLFDVGGLIFKDFIKLISGLGIAVLMLVLIKYVFS